MKKCMKPLKFSNFLRCSSFILRCSLIVKKNFTSKQKLDFCVKMLSYFSTKRFAFQLQNLTTKTLPYVKFSVNLAPKWDLHPYPWNRTSIESIWATWVHEWLKLVLRLVPLIISWFFLFTYGARSNFQVKKWGFFISVSLVIGT